MFPVLKSVVPSPKIAMSRLSKLIHGRASSKSHCTPPSHSTESANVVQNLLSPAKFAQLQSPFTSPVSIPDPCKSYLSTPPRSDPSVAISTESPSTPSVRAEDSMEGESTSFLLDDHYTNATILLEKVRHFLKVSGFLVACNSHSVYQKLIKR